MKRWRNSRRRSPRCSAHRSTGFRYVDAPWCDADIGGPWTNWSASSGELPLLNLMAGLESPDSEQVRLDGLDLSTLGDPAP